jgi:hypothetical protein
MPRSKHRRKPDGKAVAHPERGKPEAGQLKGQIQFVSDGDAVLACGRDLGLMRAVGNPSLGQI